jgi:hypothetical protein
MLVICSFVQASGTAGQVDVCVGAYSLKQRVCLEHRQFGLDNMLTSSPVPPSSSSARLSGLRRKKPSHHTRRPPPSRAVSMFSSLKSLVTTPLSWFANTGNDTFESEDTPGKRKLVHGSSRPYDSDGEQHDTPSAYRVKRIRLNSPERVATSPVPHPAPYLDPPTSTLRASTLPRSHAPRSTRPYALSSNRIPIPLPDTSRLSPLSNPPRTHAAAISRTMSMDPPTARRPSVPLPLPISRDVSMEFSPNLSAEPPNPPFRMRSALTPQPGAPLYGPNPQRRERNPSEPPPLTSLIENPIFVKPPSVPQEPRRVSDDSSSLTLGSLVGAQKSVYILFSHPLPSPTYQYHQGLTTHRSHSTLVLPSQSSSGKSGSCSSILFVLSLPQAFGPPTQQSLHSRSLRNIALPSCLPVLGPLTSMEPFRNSSRHGKKHGHSSL